MLLNLLLIHHAASESHSSLELDFFLEYDSKPEYTDLSVHDPLYL